MIDTSAFRRELAAFASMSVLERDVIASLAGLGMVVVLTLIGLAFDGNWVKFVRVGVSFGVYTTSCLLLFRAAGKQLRYWPFALSAALAAALSVSVNVSFDIIPPEAYARTLMVAIVAAAIFLGGVHYLGVRFWRRIVDAIAARSAS
jgi:hypothetical protein